MQIERRERHTVRFWLDVADDDERAVWRWLSGQRQQRKMRPAIYSALRLFTALKHGDISVLLELFPDVVSTIERGAVSIIDDRLRSLEAKITLMPDNRAPPSAMTRPAPQSKEVLKEADESILDNFLDIFG